MDADPSTDTKTNTQHSPAHGPAHATTATRTKKKRGPRRRSVARPVDRRKLAKLIAERNPGVTYRAALDEVRRVADALIEALARGERVEIRGLGGFRPSLRPARRRPLPTPAGGSAMEMAEVPERAGIVFHAPRALRERLLRALRPAR